MTAARKRVYLDWNATAPLRPEARAAMLAALDLTGNASSVHAEGRRARASVERAREQVAALVGCKPGEVVFTSGATEANATVIAAGWDAVWAADTEHPSVTAAADRTGRRVRLPVDSKGHIAVPQQTSGALVCVQAANGETGLLSAGGSAENPSLIGDGLHAAPRGKLPWHCDATQVVGRVPFDFAASGAATAAISSHKLGGPQGVGALIIRDGTPLAPLLLGGGQEKRRRAGTENVAGIAGFGAAAEAARLGLSDFARVQDLRDHLEARVREFAPDAVIVGAAPDAPARRLPNTSCLLLPGRSAETLLMQVDLAGIAISSGSACSSGKVGASLVLAAMGIPDDLARSAIRISLGWSTATADIETFIAAFAAIVRQAPDRAAAARGPGRTSTLEGMQHARSA